MYFQIFIFIFSLTSLTFLTNAELNKPTKLVSLKEDVFAISDAKVRVKREDQPTTVPPTPTEPSVSVAPSGQPTEPTSAVSSGASRSAPASGGDDAGDISPDIGPDPFPTSVKWANFVKMIEVIVSGATAIMKSLVAQSAGATTAGENEKATFISNFSELYKTLPEYLEPIQDHLKDSIPYSKINPAINLLTIPALNDLAKSNPTKILDKTRLKWIEVNAMAITIHYAFDRMMDLFSGHGLHEIDRTSAIGYPSWIEKNVLNDTADPYVEKTTGQLVAMIHEGITALGDTDHLIRGLERILRRKVTESTASWIHLLARLTTEVFYCFGNNEYGVIHDAFDLLTDATLYLVCADIKQAGLELTHAISKAFVATPQSDGSAPPDISKTFEDILMSMTERIDRKVKFSANLADLPANAIIPGPTTFKCDRPPKPVDPTKGPMITSDRFPPGVYIQNNIAYNPDGTALTNDAEGIPTLPDGTKLPAELRPIWQGSDGLPIHVYNANDKGEPIGEDGTPIPATKVMVLIPIDSKTPKLTNPEYPMTEWGISAPLGITPRSNGLEPPLDPQTGPNVADGYLDTRKPDLLAAQFTNAFSGYLEAEQVLSSDGHCVGTCLDYKYPTTTCNNNSVQCEDFRKAICEPGKNCTEKSNCPSRARRCVPTSPVVNFCPSSGNSSLYDWIKIKGKILGAESSSGNETGGAATDLPCSGEVQIAKERWESELGILMNAPQYCEVCLCVCEDPLVSDGTNFFNTEELVSNVGEGFVITAVKFERIEADKTMRISIEEGKMIADGIVDPTSVKWVDKPLNKDKNVVLGVSGFKKFNLDVVYALPSEVVTGIKFAKKDDSDSLSLEVQFTKLSAHGTLEGGASEWRGPNYPEVKPERELYDLTDAENPMNQKGPSQPFHVPDNSRAVEFDASSLEKDAGNSVVPFFDLQAVQHHSNKRALASIGILYKSKRGSGGFLTPAVSTYTKQWTLPGTL